MRLIRWMAPCVALMAILTAGCGGSEGQLFEKTIPAPSLHGNMFNEPVEQPIAVYLPPRYASADDRYPVVYLLPGFNTGVESFLDGRYEGFMLAASMDQLIASGKIDEMIVVVVSSRNFLGDSFFVNSSVTGNWEDYLVRDVVRYVDKNYKTLAYPEKRGITGYTTGGNAAFEVAMRHPDVFSAVYSLSPGLFDRKGLRLHGMLGDRDIVKTLLDKWREFGAMPRELAHESYVSYIDALFSAGGPRDLNYVFAYAYGSAYAPDPPSNAPYVSFPHMESGGTISLNMAAWDDWDRGFGRIDEKIETYTDNLLRLRGIVFEFGGFERDWMLDGGEYFTTRLSLAGVAVELVVQEGEHGEVDDEGHDGGHVHELRSRLEEAMFPWFSRMFAAD